MHYPESRFCIRRIRLAADSELTKSLLNSGYLIEPCASGDKRTVVVSFPIDFGPGIRSLSEVTMWEQLALASFLQRYWSDNQVSSTITFDPKAEGPHLKHALDYYQYQLKGISFLPRLESGAYPQMPFEAIDEKTYNQMKVDIDQRKSNNIDICTPPIKTQDPQMNRFCDNDYCEL